MFANASILRLGSRTVARLSSSTMAVRCQSTLNGSYANILVDSTPETGVAVITLNRPKALNALSDALFQDLLHASRALEDDPSIGCLVLTGSTKAFAAGADISEMQAKTFEQVYEKDWIAEWQNFSRDTSKPVIAAVSGFCLGGGCELAMMCDIILCSESAKFGQPEINLGVIPGAGGTQRLTKMIGKSKAMHLCLTGDFLKAPEAYASGLVAKVYTDDELLPKSVEMAEKIASKGRLSVKACKESVKAADELPLQEGLRLERRLFQSLFATEDQKEGMQAFLEKRAPQFKKY